jgi:hypothetical protein
MRIPYTVPVAIVVLVLLATACGGGGKPSFPRGSEVVELDPADFTTQIDNTYWPMHPGSRWVYRERGNKGSEQRVEVVVTEMTKVIMGVEARVIHDVVTEDGQIVEDTFDWYAQASDGSIWYLGEDTKEYENGKVTSTEGSWEAGVDGAQAGVLLPGKPEVGVAYREEYLEGEAEDAAEILSLNEWVEVPYGFFREEVLMTKEFTPLDRKVLEHKFYAKGVGPVLVLGVSGGAAREELIELTRS